MMTAGASQRLGTRRVSLAGLRAHPDLLAAAALGVCFAALMSLTWRKWGVPEIDAGAELTTADLLAHGATAYQDVRYFYGPLGVYGLALAFKVFGTSFTTAYGFGLVQSAAILATFYALARHWLRPTGAALTTAVVMAIGFSGTSYNFVLPHSSSATIGLLCLLLALLALTRRREWLAGVALGLVGLTRPEYAAVAAAIAVAYVIGTVRDAGRPAALRTAVRLAVPAVTIPVVVLGAFAARVGLSELLWENLWPVDFLRVGGLRTESDWMPFTAGSALGLLLRAAVYGGLLAGAVAAMAGLRGRATGAARVRALWPLALAVVTLGLLDGLLRVTGIAEAQRAAIEDECRHLTVGMSWLPALALLTGAWALVRLLRRRPAPLSRSWALDLALIAAAAALGLRAYNAFSTEGSYAPYYAAPLVLLAGILHERLGDRVPAARRVAYAALAATALGLSSYALVGLYADQSAIVHTPRGSFVTNAPAASALQAAVDAVTAGSAPGERLLAGPADGGLYFMTGRRPVLRELMLLPGLLDSRADQVAATQRLARDRVPLAVLGARDFSAWGWTTWGRDYNAVVGGWLRDHTARREVLGSLNAPVGGTNPSNGFTVLTLDR